MSIDFHFSDGDPIYIKMTVVYCGGPRCEEEIKIAGSLDQIEAHHIARDHGWGYEEVEDGLSLFCPKCLKKIDEQG